VADPYCLPNNLEGRREPLYQQSPLVLGGGEGGSKIAIPLKEAKQRYGACEICWP